MRVAREFTRAQCDALYEAVRTHDEVDDTATLPAQVHADYDRETLARCYRLCRQLWVEGVDRRAFLGIVRRARGGALGDRDAAAFKNIRAKFKQLRFACATLGEAHRYPRLLDWTTQTMGRLQDGVRTGDRGAVARNAFALRLLLSPVPYRLLRREIDGFRPATAASVRDHLRDETAAMADAIAQPAITGKAFHRLRKAVSRQVALYDTLRTLEPSAYHDRVGRYLGTINGLMGARHDDLVAAKQRDPGGYHDRPFALPAAIRDRLETLVLARR